MERATGLLRHLVLVRFKDEITPDMIEEIITKWASLQNVIKQIKAFYWGTDVSREKLQQGFTHAIEIHFESEDAVVEYLVHPTHVDFDEHTFKPSYQEILVFDYYPIRVKA